MKPTEREKLELRVAEARRSSDGLRTLFLELVEEHGHSVASRLWWAIFSASDAAET